MFTPRHPRTHPVVADVRALESVLDIDGLVDRAMEQSRYIPVRL